MRELRAKAFELLFGNAPVAGGAFEAAASWSDVLDLCQTWRAIPALGIRLGEIGYNMPAGPRARLQQLLSQSFVTTATAIKAGSDALALLEANAIACCAFKGMATIAILRHGPRHRTLQDVDILIRHHDLKLALALLASHGYKSEFSNSLEEYISFVRNSPGSAGNEALSLTNALGGAVDLHWRLGSLDTAVLLGGTTRRAVLNREVPVMHPLHSLLLTCHHALRNDFVADEMIRDLLDFDQLLSSGEIETQPAMETARRWGLAGAALAMEKIARRLKGVPDNILATWATPAELRVAGQLAALFFHQLQNGPLNTDLIYLAGHRPILKILAGASSGWKRYRTYMQALEQANGQGDVTLPQRFWRLTKAAIQQPTLNWPRIRALAAAKEGALEKAPRGLSGASELHGKPEQCGIRLD